MKRMLINATQEEELRMAMVDGQRLYDLNIELPSGERKKANIYKGKIIRVEPSLEAAFVDYGADRHGFLPLKEVSSEYYVKPVASGSKPNIREVLKEGQDIVIQIDKEERGNKGAALTTFVSLAGRFIVLKPNKSKSGGVSRRIVGEDRDLARQSLRGVDIPDGMSVILRTAGIDRDSEELEWDLNNLLSIWEAIKSVVLSRPSPFLIYRESNAIVRALRDYLTNEVGEILIDDEDTYKEALEFVEQVMPHNQCKLKFYSDPVPLFTRYQIESQIESAFAHNVTLPSGGSIVIDHTEALVAIDINSARATKGSDIGETAYQTNLEAAEEVGRQLRLRDLGGLVVIDFIDMGPQKNQRAVETRLRDAVRQDRARVQFGKISRFGLLEMSRQRLRPSLGESSNLTCPRCSGIGNIRSVESLALAILRLIGEEARKELTAKVIAQLPVEVATYLLNEKREWVQSLESRHEMQVILIANPLLETPNYQVRRIRDDQLDLPENTGTSFALVETEQEQVIPQAIQRTPTKLAAVATVAAVTPPPERKKPPRKGFWTWLGGLFRSDEPSDRGKKRSAGRKSHKKSDARSGGGQRGRRRGQSNKSGENRNAPRKPQAAQKTAKNPEGKGSKRKTQAKSSGGRAAEEQKGKTVESSQQDGTEEAKSETRKSGSRRRSRGGRRRRRGGEDKSGNVAASEENQQSAAAAEIKASDSDVQEVATRQESKPAEKAAQEVTAKHDTATTQQEEKKTVAAKPELSTESESKPAPAPDVAAVSKPVDRPAPKPVVSEAPQEKPSAPTADPAKTQVKTYDVDYEDTQPSLPILKSPDEVKVDVKPVAAAKKEPVKAAPESAAPKGNGDEKPTQAPKSEAAKPDGRLLPWGPEAEEQPSDKESGS